MRGVRHTIPAVSGVRAHRKRFAVARFVGAHCAVARTALAAVACALTLGATTTLAQSNPLSRVLSGGSATTTAKPDPNASAPDDAGSQTARAEINRALAAARRELEAIEAAPNAALGAPPDTPPTEIVDRLALARQLVGLYQQQLDMLERTDAARVQRADAEQTLADWRGFPTPPPHSLLVVDALRDDEESAEARIASTAARRSLFDRYGNAIDARLKATQASARLAAEAADRGRGAGEAAKLAWQRDVATLRARVDGATQELLQMGVRNTREETAAAEAARDLARRQLAEVGHEVVLAPGDLARIHADLAARRRAVEGELERAVRASGTAVQVRAAADDRLAQARANPAREGEDPAARAARLEALANDARAKREIAGTAAMRVDALNQYLLVLDGERITWDARADAMKEHDPLRARTVYERLTGSLATVRTFREYLNQQLAGARVRVAEEETRLRTATGADAAHAQELLDTYRQRENTLRLTLERGQPLERLLDRFRSDFEGRREVSFTERARDAAAGAWLAFRRIWNFEISTVDDTFETADGRRISVARSVTIGKTVGAVLIVVFGYWLCRAIARRVERIFVARGHVAPQSAALARNWILFALTAILVVFALVSASIPLTVFAFLGGALAIAAGFGLQTLLKNLVSGIMLLVERPLRLGDLVEVDGIRGRVTEIGIRASTILSADGIESLVPNSTFVENKVTNWTYTSPKARQTIAIGVAYGTPLRKAADAMEGVLARHGHVLKEPAPQVYLDDFADSSIGFVLTYWVEMTMTNDARRIKSDVLHMLDRALAEAGIAIPFPQQDVHLDAAKPLRVEMVAPPRAGDAAG